MALFQANASSQKKVYLNSCKSFFKKRGCNKTNKNIDPGIGKSFVFYSISRSILAIVNRTQ